MNALVQPFVGIVTFRIGPQDLPASTVLLGIALAAYALAGTLAAAISLGPWRAIAAGALGTALLAALTTTLLYAAGRRERTTQTLTALAGADALITTLTLPVLLYAQSTAPHGNPLVGLALLATMVWSICVFGHVLRHALDTHNAVGVGIALVYTTIGFALFTQLFGGG